MKNTKEKQNIMMTDIKNVLICGLGGIGCVCASNILDTNSANLKILIDKQRWDFYTKNPTSFNNKIYEFDYILPENTNFKADLIIIATKSNGLDSAIKNIKNFVKKDTIIISLLNGLNSEEKIASIYGNKNLLYSFYLGCSCFREGRNIIQDGNYYKIIIGSKDNTQTDILQKLDDFFNKSNIKHCISNNILDEFWKKFMINIGINQLSAITGKTLSEIKQDNTLVYELKSLMKEAEIIAEKEGIKNHKQIYDSAEKFLLVELDEARTSMYQDIKEGRKTEVDLFSGYLLQLAKKHNISVPYNERAYIRIKELEQNQKIFC